MRTEPFAVKPTSPPRPVLGKHVAFNPLNKPTRWVLFPLLHQRFEAQRVKPFSTYVDLVAVAGVTPPPLVCPAGVPSVPLATVPALRCGPRGSSLDRPGLGLLQREWRFLVFGVVTFMSSASWLPSEPDVSTRPSSHAIPWPLKWTAKCRRKDRHCSWSWPLSLLGRPPPPGPAHLLPAHTPLTCTRPRRHTFSSSRADWVFATYEARS